jgi:hypothetical protein
LLRAREGEVPVTVKVNGTVNSLVHKGSNHFSSATLPDVCKTPSPGGPVPLPYPNLSLSSSLAKGSTTVKADGGQMIAIKGSEFSMSQGDEPGTAGGVKSNTFKKESTWILYSFDVKIDGANACRLTDKKFQNHENTADMMGAGGPPVATEPFVVNIDCDQKMNKPDPGSEKWDKCMCQQLCAKVKKMDDARKAGKLSPSPGARLSPDYARYKKQFINNFMARMESKKGVRRMFIHPCAADKYDEQVRPGNPTEGGSSAPFNADHMHEAAWGADLTDLNNFRMMDRRVNGTISFQKYEPEGKNKGKPIKCHESCNCPHGPE